MTLAITSAAFHSSVDERSAPFYNIFDPPVVDNSTASYQYIDLKENNVSVKDLSSYEIRTQNRDSWIHPHNSYLYVCGRVLNTDGSSLGATDIVSLQNNGFNLFSTAQYFIEDTLVENIQNVGLITLANNLIDFSDDYAKSSASNSFWYKDTADSTNLDPQMYDEADKETQVKDVTRTLLYLAKGFNYNPEYNKGFRTRVSICKSSNMVSMFLPLSRLFGFCRDNNKIFRGVEHSIKLQKNSNANILITSTNKSFQFELSTLSWKLPKVIPSLATMSQLETALANKSTSTLMWEANTIHRSAVMTANDQQVDWQVTTSTHKPTHIYLMFQKASREGNMKGNNMLFDNMDLERLHVTLNSTKQYPDTGYVCNFTDEKADYSEVYTSFLAAGLKSLAVDTGTVVSYNEFKSLYPIFHIDVSKRDDSLYESQSTTNIQLSYTLRSPASENYYAYCMVESERSATLSALDRRLLVTL